MSTAERTYRPEILAIPDMPVRIGKLPTHRGYPVPWFVVWLDPENEARTMPVGEGEPDFRVIRPNGIADAWNKKRCWICGEPLGKYKSFVAGPMCGVNRTSSEPPSHLDCADWSARACPFLTRPGMRRREAGMPEADDAPGIMLRRNPGVAMVWTTLVTNPFAAATGDGVLFRMGEPEHVRWYCEGRPANYAEVLASIESGLPALREMAELQVGGVQALQRQLAKALTLLPTEGS